MNGVCSTDVLPPTSQLPSISTLTALGTPGVSSTPSTDVDATTYVPGVGVEERSAPGAVADEQEATRGAIPEGQGKRPAQPLGDALAVLGISGQNRFGIGGGARCEILAPRKRPVEDDLDLLVARMLDGMCLDLELTLSRSAPDDEAAQAGQSTS